MKNFIWVKDDFQTPNEAEISYACVPIKEIKSVCVLKNEPNIVITTNDHVYIEKCKDQEECVHRMSDLTRGF